jgi:hypothetical protein
MSEQSSSTNFQMSGRLTIVIVLVGVLIGSFFLCCICHLCYLKYIQKQDSISSSTSVLSYRTSSDSGRIMTIETLPEYVPPYQAYPISQVEITMPESIKYIEQPPTYYSSNEMRRSGVPVSSLSVAGPAVVRLN